LGLDAQPLRKILEAFRKELASGEVNPINSSENQ